MPRLRQRGVVLGVIICEIIILGAGSPVFAHPLLQLLEMVPIDAPSAHGMPFASFVDLAAIFSVYGVENRTEIKDFETLSSSVPFGRMLSNCCACPWVDYFILFGSTKPSVGFEWLLDVDAVITFEHRMLSWMVVKGRFEADSIKRALQSRGFAVRTVSGAEVLYRFDDYEARLGTRAEPFDPFWGFVGKGFFAVSARIALVDNCILAARAWPAIEAMLLAYNGEQPSLLDDPALRTLAQTVTTRPGLLTQALFYRWKDLQPQDERVKKLLKQIGITLEPPLPPFQLAVLSDIQLGRVEENNDQILLIGLFYPNPLDALAAADVLASRVILQASPVTERLTTGGWREECRVSSYVLNASPDEGAVAVVEIRYPMHKIFEWEVPTISRLICRFFLSIFQGECWFFW